MAQTGGKYGTNILAGKGCMDNQCREDISHMGIKAKIAFKNKNRRPFTQTILVLYVSQACFFEKLQV